MYCSKYFQHEIEKRNSITITAQRSVYIFQNVLSTVEIIVNSIKPHEKLRQLSYSIYFMKRENNCRQFISIQPHKPTNLFGFSIRFGLLISMIRKKFENDIHMLNIIASINVWKKFGRIFMNFI